jgi:CP family cyanate transporter-like MFS transporter
MFLVLALIGLNMRPLPRQSGLYFTRSTGNEFTVASLLTALPMVAMGGLALAWRLDLVIFASVIAWRSVC